jgi:hypothetical protein
MWTRLGLGSALLSALIYAGRCIVPVMVAESMTCLRPAGMWCGSVFFDRLRAAAREMWLLGVPTLVALTCAGAYLYRALEIRRLHSVAAALPAEERVRALRALASDPLPDTRAVATSLLGLGSPHAEVAPAGAREGRGDEAAAW